MTDESKESKIEKSFEKAIEKRITKGITRIADPVAAVIFTTLFLVLFNYYYDSISFLTSDFDQILPLYNLSLIVGIILNASRILVSGKGYKLLTDVVSNIFFFIIAYKLWTIYPFDTSVITVGSQQTWDLVFKILIVFPPVASFIGMVTEVGKFAVQDHEAE